MGRLLTLCFARAGVSDTLGAIAGGVTNQAIEIVNGQAAPGTAILTLTHGTSANQLDFSQFGAANYILDTAGKGARFKYQNGVWRCITKW